MSTILGRIVHSRRKRIEKDGFTLGTNVPAQRRESLPLVPFVQHPLVVCEIKRRSPSRGSISPDMDPLVQAGLYREQGITSLSVLTEEEHFSGSLNDLMAVKAAFPNCAVLRKDFLLEEEDIRVSHRAGADAVLLIAGILPPPKIAAMYELSRELGITPLVEVHNADELNVLRRAAIEPELMGINARNLSTFQVDLLAPLALRREIDWPCDVLFESGIFAPEQVALAASMGFAGVLVGEAAVRKPECIASLRRALSDFQNYPAAGAEFWAALMQRMQNYRHHHPLVKNHHHRPLVKICGLCREMDARRAAERGADILGFVFAESPRKATYPLLRELADIELPKVAVLTGTPSEELRCAHGEGLIHAFQYHGDECPEDCSERGLPFYKAIRLKNAGDTRAIMNFSSPRVLVDAWSPHSRGGTGKQIQPELIRSAAAHKPLWLAGGIGPDNVASVVQNYDPELIDVSSGVESEPGKKDAAKLDQFFQELSHAGVQ